MSIIEKLGITPIWDPAEISMKIGDTKNQTTADLKCALAAPEMLLAIIGMVDCAETNSMYKAAKILELMKEVAEKACYPKKWEEIKELLK